MSDEAVVANMLKMVSIRALAQDHTGNHEPEWLKVIWEANTIADERGHGKQAIFGAPESTGKWWAGGSVEEYEHARVLHRGDRSVSIVSKTQFGAEMLQAAGERLGILTNPVVSVYTKEES